MRNNSTTAGPAGPGGTRAADAFLPFAMPDLDDAELAAVRAVLESGWVTTGPATREFERAFAETVGSRHAVAVNSCTAALHLALEAVGLGEGDEVITTPYTFAATAEVIRYCGARPVFVDVDPMTLNMNPELIGRAAGPKTRAILPVHIAGLAADLDGIHGAARRIGVPVIEDAAHAFPSTYHGRTIGALSSLTCFSFYATKTMTTGEGGMVCTDDDAYADRCRIMSLHGISRDAWKRYTAEGSWYYEILAPGFKYNLTDLASAIGLVQLRKAPGMAERRRRVAAAYTSAFRDLPEVQVPAEDPSCGHAWHLYMLRLATERLDIDRARFIEELRERGIGASVHFIPLHVHPYYRRTYGTAPADFPVAYREYLREVSLPIYSKMSVQDVERVVDAVQDIVRRYRR